VAARANADRQRADAEEAGRKLVRARELAAQSLLPESDLETAEATALAAAAQLKAAQAAVAQAEASVRQAEVDLAHTVIEAPIDGVVIARNVDVGQTVAASFQAPVLFVIAKDLASMQVNASIDEADIGRVRAGQGVLFRVDAYPEREFRGEVRQVRLQPVTLQNVVTYNTIIAVDNAQQRLMPGMTATVSVIVRRADGVLRTPAAALRFHPERAAPSSERGRALGSAPAAAATTPARRGPRLGGDAAADGRPVSGRETVLYVLGPQGQPQPAPVRLGLSDGQYVELLEGLQEGARLITGTSNPADRREPRAGSSPAASSNPFSPQFQRRQR
jgi:HlyD family secretion protein